MQKISKIRDAVAWNATGLDSAKREMVPEDQRLLADGGVALSSFASLLRMMFGLLSWHRLKRTVPWIPCLRLWLLIVRRIATKDYPSHKFLPDYRLLPQCLEESTDHAALTEKRGLSLCSATCARLATFTSFLS